MDDINCLKMMKEQTKITICIMKGWKGFYNINYTYIHTSKSSLNIIPVLG